MLLWKVSGQHQIDFCARKDRAARAYGGSDLDSADFVEVLDSISHGIVQRAFSVCNDLTNVQCAQRPRLRPVFYHRTMEARPKHDRCTTENGLGWRAFLRCKLFITPTPYHTRSIIAMRTSHMNIRFKLAPVHSDGESYELRACKKTEGFGYCARSGHDHIGHATPANAFYL
jgi:hypothetical protein